MREARGWRRGGGVEKLPPEPSGMRANGGEEEAI